MSILKSKKRAAETRQLKKSDIAFYRMTGVFAIACIFVLLVLRMESTLFLKESSGENLTYNLNRVFTSPWFIVPAVMVFAASVVWFVYNKKKKTDESTRLFTSTNALVVAIYLASFVLCFGVSKSSDMHGFFITYTVIAAIIYYVSKIYNYDFTLFSSVTAVNVLAVYLLANRFSALFVFVKLVIVALSVAAVFLFNKQINGMKLSKKRKESYLIYPAYVSAAMGAVFMFIRFLSTLSSYFSIGSFETAETSPALAVKIADFAASVDLKVMFMAFLIEYIVFAIIYTLRLIRD